MHETFVAVESSVTSLGGASLVTQEELVRVLDNKMTELGKRIEKQIGRNMQSHAPPPAIGAQCMIEHLKLTPTTCCSLWVYLTPC